MDARRKAFEKAIGGLIRKADSQDSWDFFHKWLDDLCRKDENKDLFFWYAIEDCIGYVSKRGELYLITNAMPSRYDVSHVSIEGADFYYDIIQFGLCGGECLIFDCVDNFFRECHDDWLRKDIIDDIERWERQNL